MTLARHVTLFHSPNTRSSGVLILLEELRADYALQVLNMKVGEHREAGYLAINPMGKVPALLHGEAVVTEQPAIYIYLADRICGGWCITPPASNRQWWTARKSANRRQKGCARTAISTVCFAP